MDELKVGDFAEVIEEAARLQRYQKPYVEVGDIVRIEAVNNIYGNFVDVDVKVILGRSLGRPNYSLPKRKLKKIEFKEN